MIHDVAARAGRRVVTASIGQFFPFLAILAAMPAKAGQACETARRYVYSVDRLVAAFSSYLIGFVLVEGGATAVLYRADGGSPRRSHNCEPPPSTTISAPVV